MYNQKLINILITILGYLTILGSVIFFAMGFFMAAEETSDATEAVGFWVGYEVSMLATMSFFYVILGVLYRVNNK